MRIAGVLRMSLEFWERFNFCHGGNKKKHKIPVNSQVFASALLSFSVTKSHFHVFPVEDGDVGVLWVQKLHSQVGEARLAFQKLQHPQLEEAHVLLDVAIPAYMALNDPPKVPNGGLKNWWW